MENGTDYWTTGTFDETSNQFVPAESVGVYSILYSYCTPYCTHALYS
jgi:hypothetical protein